MRDLPDIEAILALAVESRDAALAARARAIAERERPNAFAAMRAALEIRYGPAPDFSLLARLAAEVRAGRLDPLTPEGQAVERLLWALTVQKLRECNPDFLL